MNMRLNGDVAGVTMGDIPGVSTGNFNNSRHASELHPVGAPVGGLLDHVTHATEVLPGGGTSPAHIPVGPPGGIQGKQHTTDSRSCDLPPSNHAAPSHLSNYGLVIHESNSNLPGSQTNLPGSQTNPPGSQTNPPGSQTEPTTSTEPRGPSVRHRAPPRDTSLTRSHDSTDGEPKRRPSVVLVDSSGHFQVLSTPSDGDTDLTLTMDSAGSFTDSIVEEMTVAIETDSHDNDLDSPRYHCLTPSTADAQHSHR